MVRTIVPRPVRLRLQDSWDSEKISAVKCYSENAGFFVFWDSIFRSSTKSIFTGTVRHLFGCAENALKMLGFVVVPPVGSNGRKRVTLLQKTYGTTKHISAVGSNARIINKASTIHPHHSSKILFQNEDSHSKKNLGCDSSLSLSISKYRLVNPNPTVRPEYDSKTYQQQQERSRKKRSFDDSSSSLQ